MDRAPNSGGIADILFAMRRKGVRIWPENGRLRYQATGTNLAQEDLEVLRARRADIIAFFQDSASPLSVDTAPTARDPGEPIPLSFGQNSWFTGLGGRLSLRMGVARRLSGRLDVKALQQSFVELVVRHESLRTRIVSVDGDPRQVVDEPPANVLDTVDLTTRPNDNRELDARSLIEQFVAEPIDLAKGPLFAARLLRLREFDHVLIVALDHLIMDGASLAILWRDIWTVYGRYTQGLPFSLPPLPIQFGDYAVWQKKILPFWLNEHEAYWKQRLVGAPGVRFARDEKLRHAAGWGKRPIFFGEALSAKLRQLGERKHTSLALTVLSVYIALASRWYETRDILVEFMGSARVYPEVEEVIGFIACPLMLRIALAEDERFTDLVTRVTKEYTTAYEHSHAGMLPVDALKSAGVPICFGWVPEEFSMGFVPDLASYGVDRSVSIEPFEFAMKSFLFEDIDLDRGPAPNLVETDRGVIGTMVYRTNCSSATAVGQLIESFYDFAMRVVGEPTARIETIAMARAPLAVKVSELASH